MGAAIARCVPRDTAKLSVSHVLFCRSSTHIDVGNAFELHSSIPVSNSKLNAVYPFGSGTTYQRPLAVRSTSTGAIECVDFAELLQS